MNPFSYFPFFLITTVIVCIFFGTHYMGSNGYAMQERGYRNSYVALLICIVLVFWMGMRPNSIAFGDTVNYAAVYRLHEYGTAGIDWNEEWFWEWISQTCFNLGFSYSGFFTVIEAGYILCAFFAVRILLPKNILLGILFVLASFQFFTFGVNGMRNGLACHMVMLAIALYLDGKLPFAVIIAALAFGVHRSIVLPVASFIAAVYVIKDPKYAIYIWLASIPVSFVSGFTFVNFFSGLGFDDRMEQYLSVEGGALETTTSSFRWDFLLYSAMPVLMSWIVIVKRQVTDNWYNILATTYCLSNAFWVLVIRASFTNRFAYLSWFIFPIVIAYPLIMLPIWEDQDNKTGVVLIAYALLTLGICYFTHMI